MTTSLTSTESKDVKLQAAPKVLDYLNNKTPQALNANEYKALSDKRLGDIVQKHKNELLKEFFISPFRYIPN